MNRVTGSWRVYMNNVSKASGCIILSEATKRILLQLRAPDRRDNVLWGFWGGTIENSELPKDTLLRELEEEIGFLPPITKFYPIHTMISNNCRFEYYTFMVSVPDEFVPKINDESVGYSWVKYDHYPYPLHPGARTVLQNPRILSKIRTIIETV